MQTGTPPAVTRPLPHCQPVRGEKPARSWVDLLGMASFIVMSTATVALAHADSQIKRAAGKRVWWA